MSISVDGRFGVYGVAAAQQAKRGFVPRNDLLPLANSYFSAVGPLPGRAYLVMGAGDASILASQGPVFHTINFSDALQNSVTLRSLIYLRARRVNRGYSPAQLSARFAGNGNVMVLAEFADPRWLCKNPFFTPTCNRQFNVRAPAGGQTYYQDSLNAGQPYTWQHVLDTLWGDLNQTAVLGPSPQQIINVDGVPENLQFVGVSTWDAYNQVLARMGFVFFWDPLNAQSSIWPYTPGPFTETPLAAAIRAYQPRLLHDTEDWVNLAAICPQTLIQWNPGRRVNYGTEKSTGWAAGQQEIFQGLKPIDFDVAGNLPPFFQGQFFPNTEHGIIDDEAALLNFDDSTSNLTALVDRVNDRGQTYLDTLLGVGHYPRHFIFHGIINNPALIGPQEILSGVCWRESGQGYQTEIVIYPPQTPPELIRFHEDMPWTPFGTGADLPAQAYRPPNLGRTTYPVYPPVSQPVRITASTKIPVPPDNTYPGKVQRMDPADPGGSIVAHDEEDCWCWFPTGDVPFVGLYVNARLIGSQAFNGELHPRPVYMCLGLSYLQCQINGTPGTIVTPNADGTFDANLVVINPTTLVQTVTTSVIWFYDPNLPAGLLAGQTFMAGLLTVYNGRALGVRDDFNQLAQTSAGATFMHGVLAHRIGKGTNVGTEDFLFSNPSARVLQWRTVGVNQDFVVCGGDGNNHTLRIDDGLIKVIS